MRCALRFHICDEVWGVVGELEILVFEDHAVDTFTICSIISDYVSSKDTEVFYNSEEVAIVVTQQFPWSDVSYK